MYDHNQTLIPDSFMAIHVRHGRPVLARDVLEAHYEIAETLAQHVAAMMDGIAADDEDGQLAALRSVKAGLSAQPRQVSEPEATWVVVRAAELCDWKAPEL